MVAVPQRSTAGLIVPQDGVPSRRIKYIFAQKKKPKRTVTGHARYVNLRRNTKCQRLSLTRYHSPLGDYVLGSSKKGVVCVKTEDRSKAYLSRWEGQGIELKERGEHNLRLISQLDAYFAGKRREFTIPLDLRGTSFQRRVWDLLCGIPWGETRSYGQIAKALGRPKAARAVGRAVGTNPVSIVVPCHRVIGSDGTLTGYGGGLDRKKALLKLEGNE